MDSKKELENNLENINKRLVEDNSNKEDIRSKKENQNDIKKLITKVDNRVKTKVDFIQTKIFFRT
jgi:hypothetical protein